MRRFAILLLAFSAFFSGQIFAKEKQVMLFVTAGDQSDTLGYNIANSLPKLLASHIESGSVALWESPSKKILISPASFITLQKQSKVKLKDCQQFFAYELWNVNTEEEKDKLRILGFSFSMKNADGEEVNFGFVDYLDVDSLLRNSVIEVTLNGHYNTTYSSILKGHQYFFSIVQYRNKGVINLMQSEEIKKENQSLLQFYHGLSWRFPSKKIGYLVSYEHEPKDVNQHRSNKLIAALQRFLTDNNEMFYNLGGDRIVEFINPSDYKISAVEVSELWTKQDSSLRYQLISMRIFVNDRPLDLLMNDQLRKYELIVDFKSIFDFLSEKEFDFRISRINDIAVSVYKSDTYLNALMSYPWSRLEEAIAQEK